MGESVLFWRWTKLLKQPRPPHHTLIVRSDPRMAFTHCTARLDPSARPA